jgi:hypothetical protein
MQRVNLGSKVRCYDLDHPVQTRYLQVIDTALLEVSSLAFNGDLSLKKKQVLSLEKNKPGLSMT